MKLDAKDFKRLQWAIAFLVVMALLGGGSLWATQQMKMGSEKSLRDTSAARKDMQTKLSRASDEQQELRDKIGRFQALQSSGHIGPEQRLDWIEALARLKTSLRILRLDYEFAPQRLLDAGLLPGGASAGGFDLMSSQMKLQLHLLHEAELLTFLAELRTTVRAQIKVRECAIERIAPGASGRASLAQLKAECTLEWVTLRESK